MILFYMPYFDSNGRGCREAQGESLLFFDTLSHSKFNDGKNIFYLQKNTGASEDRLPYFASIWGKYDIIMIESTKVPTLNQIEKMVNCDKYLCTQEYITKLPRKNNVIIDFYAHKTLLPNRGGNPPDLKDGCQMSIPDGRPSYNLVYTQKHYPAHEYCDVSDLGIIKISQKAQLYRNPDFMPVQTGHDYNTVERLHEWIFRNGFNWHRHPELAARRPDLYHVRTSERGHESEYLTYSEYAKIFFR